MMVILQKKFHRLVEYIFVLTVLPCRKIIYIIFGEYEKISVNKILL